MFSGKLSWGASTRYRGKTGQGFPSPEKVMGFEGIQQCELLLTFGVSRHYRFTTCVDQRPHWSQVGRIGYHRACTYHQTLFNIFSFIYQFEHFFVPLDIGYTNQRVTNILWMLEVKEHHIKNTKRGWAIVFLNIFWKNNLIPLISFSPISSSFLVLLKWLKMWWVHQQGLYKISLYSRDKDFKFKILICFNSHIIEYWMPYIKHLISFLYRIEQFLWHQKC
jgi:hypothetical protein